MINTLNTNTNTNANKKRDGSAGGGFAAFSGSGVRIGGN